MMMIAGFIPLFFRNVISNRVDLIVFFHLCFDLSYTDFMHCQNNISIDNKTFKQVFIIKL